eukprot:1491669-Amphidinium_carterae.2
MYVDAISTYPELIEEVTKNHPMYLPETITSTLTCNETPILLATRTEFQAARSAQVKKTPSATQHFV